MTSLHQKRKGIESSLKGMTPLKRLRSSKSMVPLLKLNKVSANFGSSEKPQLKKLLHDSAYIESSVCIKRKKENINKQTEGWNINEIRQTLDLLNTHQGLEKSELEKFNESLLRYEKLRKDSEKTLQDILKKNILLEQEIINKDNRISVLENFIGTRIII